MSRRMKEDDMVVGRRVKEWMSGMTDGLTATLLEKEYLWMSRHFNGWM